MHAARAISLKPLALAAGVMLAVFAFTPRANATVIRIQFSGTLSTNPADPGSGTNTPFNGYADLIVGTDPSASSSYPNPTVVPAFTSSSPYPTGTESIPAGTPRVDPGNAQAITGVMGGMFNGQAITGVMPIGAQTEPNPHEYVPASRTNLLATNTPDGAPVVTFDNLFYADGSPLTCLFYYPDGTTAPEYPFAGGFLDPYGVLFEIDAGGGNVEMLDLWSNGVMPGLGLNYGAILFAPATEDYVVLSSQFNGVMASVPEPGYLWLLGAGLLGLFGWRRWRESRRSAKVD